ncbi:MAG: phenylalanine--tRNA ligase subunit beta [Bacteroidota bacterium]
MNVSLNWLKDYIDIALPPEEISNILTAIGLEVEGQAEIESIKGGLEGVVVGHVLTCEKHPNADKLSITTVNVAQEQPLQIVCGAPNVAADQKVLVATVGTTLYNEEGEPLKIKKGKIRGAISEGMICAEDELGLGASHAGIMVLPETVAAGTLAKDYFQIETDTVYEIGLTPNRSDATNHLGVAKDLGAYLRINHENASGIRLPDVTAFEVHHRELPVSVEILNTTACPRYSGVSIQGVTIKESPDWLKNRLHAIGVRPISNIVDITNFILHELGQPLHAFDLDQIANHKIIVDNLATGTTFKTLDEKERQLDETDLMICDGNKKGMCIAGVFGGMESGVTEKTTNIFLESAHFAAKSLRRTSFRHDLRTDAAKVFEKGSDPNITVYALKRAALLIQELAGGTIASDIVDVYPTPIAPLHIKVGFERTRQLIGAHITNQEICDILTALEMEIVAQDDSTVTVAIPTNKADVTREVDVIEEILRIYGFNKVPIPNTINVAITYGEQPNPQEIRNLVGSYLTGVGVHEMMALSLSESRYYQELYPVPTSELVFINNTSNVHLDIMRPTMLMSGLEAILHNQNRSNANLKLYEFGRTYRKDDSDYGYAENEHLAVYVTGQQAQESWLATAKTADFYILKTLVDNLLHRLGISGYQSTALDASDNLQFGMRYHRGKQVLVEFGKVIPKLAKGMGIKSAVFYADFQWKNVMKALKNHRIKVTDLVKYPSMRRDLALVIDNSVKFSDIVAIARKTGKKLLKDINLFSVYENAEQLGEHKKSYAVSFVFEDPNKTLKDKEVEKIMNKLISDYENKLGAIIRR